ncbi:MAG: NAD(P)-dependent oxidoreductase [Methyloligellaceae bacterium]
MTQKPSVGFIGIGIMGFQMARRLLEAGHPLIAWNRTRAKAEALQDFGARVADSPGEAAQEARVAIVMVADGPASDAVILGEGERAGLLDAMRPGSFLVVMSSIPVETARAQAEAARGKGIRYLDAPVSGGEPGAREGTLAIMAGGSEPDFAELEPLFRTMGRPTRVGEAGAGSLVKLANQVIVGNTIQTVAEALLLAREGGADPAALIEALKGGFADSTILQNHGARMIAGDFNPGARSEIQLKDTRTAEELARSLGLELPVTSLVREIYESLCRHGWGDRDHNAPWLELLRRNSLQTPQEAS